MAGSWGGGQPAWQRYGRLQGVLAAGPDRPGDRSAGRPADRTAEITDRWAQEDGPGATHSAKVAQAIELGTAAGPGVLAEVVGAIAQSSDTPQIGRAFILAGNAIVTLTGSERRYTYRVQQGKPREGDSAAPDRTQPFFLQLLSGPDNTADYTYVGIVDQQTGAVRLTRASKLTRESQPIKAWDWAMRYLWAGKALPAPATVHHAGRCGRCARLLTVPRSIETGFGPECAGKLGIS